MPSVSGVKPLKLPDRHVAAFRALLRMEEDDFAQLMGVLETAKPTDGPNELAESIHRGTAVSASDARALLDALMALAALKQRSPSPSGHMAARAVASSQFASGDDKSGKFTERFKQLLSSDLIRVHSKVASIGAEYEGVSVTSQVLADRRPTFDDEIAQGPEPEAPLPPRPSPSLCKEFNRLVQQWTQDIVFTSSSHDIILHWAYQQVIGLGPQIIPLIYEEMVAGELHWNWALYAITGEDVAANTDSPRAATDVWIRWIEDQYPVGQSSLSQ